MHMELKFIDLFAGIGGFRLGFERACESLGYSPKCVFTSEIKPPALKVYSENFEDTQSIDITQVPTVEIPSFDFLLAGFPCQAFSSAGKREGFLDTRGTLFFEIERILKEHKPSGFILENVEGLVNHDKVDHSEPIGRTLNTIVTKLQSIGYKVTWRVLDSSNFGLAQARKRIFIVGTLNSSVSLNHFEIRRVKLSQILEKGLKLDENKTTKLLLKHYNLDELHGKSLKDKRGGENNIHSWDIELKGKTTKAQRDLLTAILKARRNKKWGVIKGIAWMDGMPLTLKEIKTFFDHPKLKELLEDLVRKGYLVYEHPKDLVSKIVEGTSRTGREYRTDLPKGYNIVAGKLSFEVSKILDPKYVAPTLVATDLERMMVIDGNGLRKLSSKELLRLFGFPDDFSLPGKPREIADLFGNSVPVNVVEQVATRVISVALNLEGAELLQGESVYPLQEKLPLV